MDCWVQAFLIPMESPPKLNSVAVGVIFGITERCMFRPPWADPLNRSLYSWRVAQEYQVLSDSKQHVSLIGVPF